jgi:hypothetical protein
MFSCILLFNFSIPPYKQQPNISPLFWLLRSCSIPGFKRSVQTDREKKMAEDFRTTLSEQNSGCPTESEKYIILTLFYDQNYVNLSNLKFHPLSHKVFIFLKITQLSIKIFFLGMTAILDGREDNDFRHS